MNSHSEASRRCWSELRPTGTSVRSNRTHLLSAVLALTYVCGCAPAIDESAVRNQSTAPSRAEENRIENLPQADAPIFSAVSAQTSPERLAVIWQTRQQGASTADYPIGPGDILIINVAGIEELSNRTIRVTGDGYALLPLVGSVRAVGLSEEELKATLEKKLSSYIKEPEVSIFVQEYRSRQVGVFGAVAKPGVYSLTSGTDTISDMISQAGGMIADAARRIEFIPAKAFSNDATSTSVSPPMIMPVSISGIATLNTTAAILIDLNDRHQRIYLAMPARPGDVIVVPAGGQVLVEGWVGKAGSYPITPGLRVLGAIAAAGGLLYPADSSSINIIRTGREGESIRLSLDLDRIKTGESEDVPVEEGDVVEVGATTAKLISYGVYQGIVQMFRVGAYAF